MWPDTTGLPLLEVVRSFDNPASDAEEVRKHVLDAPSDAVLSLLRGKTRLMWGPTIGDYSPPVCAVQCSTTSGFQFSTYEKKLSSRTDVADLFVAFLTGKKTWREHLVKRETEDAGNDKPANRGPRFQRLLCQFFEGIDGLFHLWKPTLNITRTDSIENIDAIGIADALNNQDGIQSVQLLKADQGIALVFHSGDLWPFSDVRKDGPPEFVHTWLNPMDPADIVQLFCEFLAADENWRSRVRSQTNPDFPTPEALAELEAMERDAQVEAST